MSKIIFNGVDYAGGSGNYFNPVIYSDVERVIGVWRDNKPLYQRTIYIPSLPNATEVSYPHNISDLDKVVEIFGITYNSSGYSIPIIFANPTYVSQVTAYTSATDIYIGTGMDRRSFVGYVTLRYTKTTDVAGSGDYNTYGVPTVHYDTNEQVIGTWFGKPLYQKAFTGLSQPTNGDNWVTINGVTIPNIGEVIGLNAFSVGGSGNMIKVALAEYSRNNNGDGVQVSVVSSAFNRTINTAVVQYTKSTD